MKQLLWKFLFRCSCFTMVIASAVFFMWNSNLFIHFEGPYKRIQQQSYPWRPYGALCDPIRKSPYWSIESNISSEVNSIRMQRATLNFRANTSLALWYDQRASKNVNVEPGKWIAYLISPKEEVNCLLNFLLQNFKYEFISLYTF